MSFSRGFKQRSASAHQFSMVPRADIPRSSFKMQKSVKTSFDAGLLVPIMCEEVLPGDTFNVRMTSFVRLATPIFPFMDNLHLETFFFFVPNRLVWDNWQKFMGEQAAPGESISYEIPQIISDVGGFAPLSLYDYFGLPTVGQVQAAAQVSVSALPARAYNLIWNEWFRSQDLQPSQTVLKGDGPDNINNYYILPRGKRHDYFTSCLPWPVKGGQQISVPLGGNAPVKVDQPASQSALGVMLSDNQFHSMATDGTVLTANSGLATSGHGMFADLSQATGATINAMRQSFQIQKLLERDARGGTRYTEILRSHFGVVSPDARLQRPEYLGGGSSPIVVNPVVQNSATGAYADSPIGTLSATAQSVGHGHGFSQSFTEHGYVIGLINVRADLTYQQGLRRHWSRRTRYDYYFPAFAMLGEQAVLNKEIYCDGTTADNDVFGYQERWAEYRYNPSEITGLMRSTNANPIDAWHLAQKFSTLPVLNASFITENPPLERVLAVGAEAAGQELLADLFFDIKAARPMPLYSVPGLIDHF